HWTPTGTSPESASVLLQVYDAQGAHSTQAFTITVNGVNRAPVFAPLVPEIDGQEGQPLQLSVAASDPDGDFVFFWADNLPPGAAFDPDLRTFTWTPDFHSAGTYENVRFVVSDGLHQVSRFTRLVIADGNQAPTLARPADLTVREGDPLHLRLEA